MTTAAGYSSGRGVGRGGGGGAGGRRPRETCGRRRLRVGRDHVEIATVGTTRLQVSTVRPHRDPTGGGIKKYTRSYFEISFALKYVHMGRDRIFSLLCFSPTASRPSVRERGRGRDGRGTWDETEREGKRVDRSTELKSLNVLNVFYGPSKVFTVGVIFVRRQHDCGRNSVMFYRFYR